MSPHGLRCWVTTCVGGRVRPFLPAGRAVPLLAVPLLAPPLPVVAVRPVPPRFPPRAGASSGLRSLAKASPRGGAGRGAGAPAAGGAPLRLRSLGAPAVRAADVRAPRDGRGRPPQRAQYARRVTPEQLSDVVRTAVAAAVDRGELAVDVPGDVVVERPKTPEHGDYATNVPLGLAKPAGRPPREVAELLAAELRTSA